MSRIRTNLITNRMANGAPTVSNGLVISGVTTVTTLDLNGDLDVDGHLNADNVSIAGVVTATSFVGSGANLTSLPAANLTGTLPAISGANLTSLPAQATVNNNADNRVITGGSGVNLYAESGFTYDGTTVQIPDRINCNTNGTYLKENQLSFNPTGTAYIDHYRTGQDIQIRMSTSSSLDTTGPTFKSNGNLAFASGKGIDFSAYSISGDQGTASAQVLDDFEEGDWTCTLSGTGGGSITASRAAYTKVGNMVMCEATFVNPGSNSVSGNWSMTLPFQFIGGGSGSYGGGQVTYTRYVPALTGGFQSYCIFTYYGQGSCYLRKLATNGSSETSAHGGSVNNSMLFSFTMTYTTGT